MLGVNINSFAGKSLGKKKKKNSLMLSSPRRKVKNSGLTCTSNKGHAVIPNTAQKRLKRLFQQKSQYFSFILSSSTASTSFSLST